MKLLKEENFRGVMKGKAVELFTLCNKNGCVAQFTNYGARWLSMWVPGKNNQWADVVLGFDSLDGYSNAGEKYHGAVIGRVCGRIDKGRFELYGNKYQLANNDLFGSPVKNHLHGGFGGFSFRVWSGKWLCNEQGEEAVEMTLLSEDMEEGYPGKLNVKVVYTLGEDDSVKINYSATTDKATIINLTNHAYFNLNNKVSNNILNHYLHINADRIVACNEALIPTGNIISIKNTPLDFTHAQTIGSRITDSFPHHLFQGKGYVVSYVLNEPAQTLSLAATAVAKESGRVMQVYTDQPGLQFYSGWLFDGRDTGKNRQRYTNSSGLALEAQGFPDAPNHPAFPSIVLQPDEVYRQTTVYRFLIE